MTVGQFARVFPSISLLILGVFAAPLFGQDLTDPGVENSRYQIEGIVNANAVFVRSGPSENDYPTMQLNKDARVTVVGERFNWLKIIPPEGSFCYVARAYVNRAGDGSIGQSTGTPYVRVGSSLNQLKTKIASKLEVNQRVEIIGEQDEYFKIKPPADVYVYINKQFVDPVRQLPSPGGSSTPPPIAANDNTGPATQPQTGVAQQDQPAPEGVTETTTPPLAQRDAAKTETPAAPPSTQPTAIAEAEFDRLEKLYSQASQRPMDEQPITELLSGYEQLANNSTLPESLRRIAEYKTSVLKGRAKMQAEFVEVKKSQEDMKAKQLALEAERKELEDRIAKATVKFYTAIGMLRTSSLQFGPTTLYRLTDPANGRTIVYLRSPDGKLGQRLGEFIGVRGDVSVDPQRNMTIIEPREFESVDPAKFGQTVAAQYAPPSLLPTSGVAGAGGE